MRALAVYYTDPFEGRQKFVILNPSPTEEEHYLWVGRHIRAVPEGHSVGLFGARMILPIKTGRRDWLLNRDHIGTIRIEEIEIPETLFGEAA